MRNTLWAVLALVTLAPCTGKANNCDHEAQRTSQDPAQGLTQVVLVAGPGSLIARGAHGATRVETTGKACATSRAYLDAIAIRTRREGSTLYIEAITPPPSGRSEWSSLDLTVTLPDNLHLDARDSSGDATFKDLASAKVFDSSGDLIVRRITGLVDLTDSSGDIDVDQVGGIIVRDSSGDIRVERVSGNAEVASDSSGDMEIREVKGNVRVVQDSSGDIRIVDVKGNATVDADSSGSIIVNRVSGDFAVLADSSGAVTHRNVRGKVSVP
jgi:hypothetical protein